MITCEWVWAYGPPCSEPTPFISYWQIGTRKQKVQVYCFLWLSYQTEAILRAIAQKGKQLAVVITTNENTMAN